MGIFSVSTINNSAILFQGAPYLFLKSNPLLYLMRHIIANLHADESYE